MRGVRFCPMPRWTIVGIRLANRGEGMAHQPERLRSEVFQWPGVPGGNDRFPPAGGIEQWITPTFTPVKGDIAVAAAVQSPNLILGPSFGMNGGSRTGTGAHPHFLKSSSCHRGRSSVCLKDEDRS